MAPKSLPGGSRKPKKQGPQHEILILPPRRAPKSLPEASGAEKKSWQTSGGPPGEFPSEFSPSQGAPEADLGSILASPGAPFWLFFELWGENLEILILTDSPSENLDFQGSGGLPGLIFEV